MYIDIDEYIASLKNNVIAQDRKELLKPLIGYIRTKRIEGKFVRINFICTHNSRRSHLAQIWMQTISQFYGFRDVQCYSGGTESTAVFPMVIETLEIIGFQIKKLDQADNTIYSVKFAENEHPVLVFSKRYDHFFNPVSEFAAVMTCAQADEECPFVRGAEERISLPYEDPKLYDGTSEEKKKYQERSAQIATELAYVIRKSLEI